MPFLGESACCSRTLSATEPERERARCPLSVPSGWLHALGYFTIRAKAAEAPGQSRKSAISRALAAPGAPHEGCRRRLRAVRGGRRPRLRRNRDAETRTWRNERGLPPQLAPPPRLVHAGCAAGEPAAAGRLRRGRAERRASSYCAWFGDARSGVLYFGEAPFWWALRADQGSDPRADLRLAGPAAHRPLRPAPPALPAAARSRRPAARRPACGTCSPTRTAASTSPTSSAPRARSTRRPARSRASTRSARA